MGNRRGALLMTDDIVKYLRLSATRFNRHYEAADEIERLRAQLKEAQNGLTYIVRSPNV